MCSGKGESLFTSLAVLQCRWLHRGQLVLLGLQSTWLCCFSLPTYLYSSTWKNQTKLQTHFRWRLFPSIVFCRDILHCLGKTKRPLVNTWPGSTFRKKKPIPRANWRIAPFTWVAAIRSGLTSALTAIGGSPLSLKMKVIF